MIFLQSHVVVLNSFREVPSLVFAGASRISCVDVVGVQLEHSREVVNALVNLVQLLVGAPPDVVSARILLV